MNKTIKKLLKDLLVSKTGEQNFDILIPPNPELGDYSTNAAFVLSKKGGEDPVKVAEDLAAELAKNKEVLDIFEKIKAVKPGFVNFYFKKEFLQKQLAEIYKKLDSFGASDIGKGKTVIVEYSSPNIAKPMHIGHLRSTIIGDALANVYEALGYKVIRWNYIGDWGTQFGKLIAAWKKWGDDKALVENPIQEMLRLYVKFHEEMKKNPELEKEGQEEFKRLESFKIGGFDKNSEIWAQFRGWSLHEFDKIYQELGIVLNKLTVKGESDYHPLKEFIEKLKESGLTKESEGALIVELPNLPPAMLQKSDGATLYMTRELASLEDRIHNYHADKVLYVVANQQALHFEQLFAIAKILDWNNVELIHVKFGMVLDEDGKKLATREGRVILLQEVIDKITDLALKVVQEKNPKLPPDEADAIAKAVGIGALKYNDLKQHPHTDVIFDWKAMLDISGNSGPYLQYAYARLSNILEKSENRKSGDPALLTEPEEEKLMRRLLEFSDAIAGCIEFNALNGLALYLYELANEANRFYESVRVLNDENYERSADAKALADRRNARLVLVETVATVLKKGLRLLGIKVLDRI